MLEMPLILIKCIIILTPLGIWIAQETFKNKLMDLVPIKPFDTYNFSHYLFTEIKGNKTQSLLYYWGPSINRTILMYVSKVIG